MARIFKDRNGNTLAPQVLDTNIVNNSGQQVQPQSKLPNASSAGQVLKSTNTTGGTEWGEGGSGGGALYQHDLTITCKSGDVHRIGFISSSNVSLSGTTVQLYNYINSLTNKVLYANGYIGLYDNIAAGTLFNITLANRSSKNWVRFNYFMHTRETIEGTETITTKLTYWDDSIIAATAPTVVDVVTQL